MGWSCSKSWTENRSFWAMLPHLNHESAANGVELPGIGQTGGPLMKTRTTIALLAAVQALAAATPVQAAELSPDRSAASQRSGGFAGARLRVPLGRAGRETVRAGLAVAPVVQDARTDGSLRTRFGEGLELGFAGSAEPRLALGGTPVRQLVGGRAGPDGRRLGVSTFGWVAIGVGVVVVAVVAAGVICLESRGCIPSE